MKTKEWFLLAPVVVAMLSPAMADNLYSTIPGTLPPNVVSLGYEATQTQEFGDLIQFGSGTSPVSVNSATVVMSNWALESTYETVGTSAGFNVPLTLNLYNVGAGDTVGSLIGTDTINAFIQWRPEASAGCAGGAWLAGDGSCYNGLAQEVTFDFSGLTVPNEIIYGLAYNTADYGYSPTGTPGPYNSLNFGLAETPPSVGSNPLPDTAYWNTSTAVNYTDGGAGGVGVFRQDTNWTPYSGAIEFDGQALPEPSTWFTFGGGLALVAFAMRKRLTKSSS